MRKLDVAVLDVLGRSRRKGLFPQFLQASSASIMPQVVATWCEQEGHRVQYACYGGHEVVIGEEPERPDLVFICTYTTSALHAYALSNLYRRRGAVTVLGGPHARAYPEDALRYFDYVTGFTTRDTISEILTECAPHRPSGLYLSAEGQPPALPGVRERWKYVAMAIERQPFFSVVPMLSSLGCPYSCSFCVDSTVPFAQMDLDEVRLDLRFIAKRLRRPLVALHDPNFGVRYDECLDVIEDAVPPGSLRFGAESSLALLTEGRLQRLKRNGFVLMMPGIESWFDFGGKSRVGRTSGEEKVRQVAEHINLVLEYVPFVQANFIMGMDCDSGTEPFDLTKRFVDLAPGPHPTLSLITSYGRSAPQNLVYQREGRIVILPFYFLNGSLWTNVRPKNYTWDELFRYLADLYDYAFSSRIIVRRVLSGTGVIPRALVTSRSLSTEGRLRVDRLDRVRKLLGDPEVERLLNGESSDVPSVFFDDIRRDMGPLWDWLPEGGSRHDAYAAIRGEPLINHQIPHASAQA